MSVKPSGSAASTILIVGDFASYADEKAAKPFIDSNGHELTKMLEDAGINRAECRLMMAVRGNPPQGDISKWITTGAKKPWESAIKYCNQWIMPFVAADFQEMWKEIWELEPRVIIALGDAALFALTGRVGIDKYRGSLEQTLDGDMLRQSTPVIGTYSPRQVVSKWEWRNIAVHDLKRAREISEKPLAYKAPPEPIFDIAPNWQTAMDILTGYEKALEIGSLPLVIDLEIKRHAIMCVGFATSRHRAFCLPFWHEAPLSALRQSPASPLEAREVARGLNDPLKSVVLRYWTDAEERILHETLRRILTHPNVQLINQNLAFDIQFLSSMLFCLPVAHFDTMVAQHVYLPGTPKSLDYLHSLWGDDYVYWKDDGKFWKDDAVVNYQQLWKYNCKDCVTTFEIYEKQQVAIKEAGLTWQFDLQMRKLNHFVKVMYRGIAVNEDLRQPLILELMQLSDWLRYELSYLLDRDFNPNSPVQLKKFFYDEIKQPVILDGYKGSPTTNFSALQEIGLREPMLRPLTDRINIFRSYTTAMSVCRAKTNPYTGRWHPSYNVAGTATYRCSSSINPWDEAMNMQNVTNGKKIGS